MEPELQETIDYIAVRRLQNAYADIVTRRAWAELHDASFDSPMLIGEQVLCDRYSTALRETGVHARIAPDDAAARGLWRIAMAAGIVR